MYIKTKVSDAIKFAGNKSKLANFLGITRQSLTSWGSYVPQSSATKLYILTDGEIGLRVNADETAPQTVQKDESTPSDNAMFYP